MNTNIFKELGKLEELRKFPDIINISIDILSNKDMSGLHKSIELNLSRILGKVERDILNYWIDPIPIYELSSNPNNYNNENAKNKLPLISLTTISDRLDRLKKTIQSIKEQTVNIHSINLYISETPYLLDNGISHDNPDLLEIHKMGVNIYSVPNSGPYRKQIPVIYQLKKIGASASTPFITIDDDVVYPNNIVERLMSGDVNSVVSHRGRAMLLGKKSIEEYSTFGIPNKKPSHMNLGTGKNGILYRLGFFPRSIRGYMGPIIAPTADDLWCKWVTALNCIPTEIIEPESAFKPELDFPESNPNDKNGLFHKFNAKGRNDIAIKNLENYYLTKFGYNIFSVYSFRGSK